MFINVKTKKIKIEFQKIQLLFSKFKKQFLNFQLQNDQYSDIYVSRNSETYNRNIFTFWVTELLCSYMYLKILLQFRYFMINFIKIPLQFGSFKIHFMKIQLSFIILRKISENSVHFSQF